MTDEKLNLKQTPTVSLSSLAPGNNVGDILGWNGTSWIAKANAAASPPIELVEYFNFSVATTIEIYLWTNSGSATYQYGAASNKDAPEQYNMTTILKIS